MYSKLAELSPYIRGGDRAIGSCCGLQRSTVYLDSGIQIIRDDVVDQFDEQSTVCLQCI